MSDHSAQEVRVVLCTCPDEETASRLAAGLVGERLAACVNILPKVQSVFRWEGEVQTEPEILMVIKTTAARYAALESWLQSNHPYDVPEVLALTVGGGSEGYLAWVEDETA